MKLRPFVAGALALALLLGPTHAGAQEAEGTLLSLQQADVVVDLGAAKGLAVGDVVEVWRPLRLRHPVTGATVSDRFRIAKLRLVQVRPALSIARLDGEADRPLAVGDIVVAPGHPDVAPPPPPSPDPKTSAKPAAGPPPPPPEPRPVPSAAPPAVVTTTTTTTTPVPPSAATSAPDPDAKRLDALFGSLKNATPGARAAAYEAFVLEHPQSRYTTTLWEEAKAFHRLEELARIDAERVARTPVPRGFVPPARATEGAPFRLALEILRARGAVLHVRRRGEPGFRSAPMASVGPGYFASTLPADVMREGTLEYFVEATDAASEAHPAAGTAETPLALAVERVVPPDSRAKERSETIITGRLLTDYASFDSKRAHDYVWQTEALLGARFGDTGLRALRSGFGAYRGKGGTLEDLDERGLAPRAVGLTYGYLELELGLSPSFGLAARGIVGLREDGVNGGAQGFIRFGSDRRTNLLFGGEVLGGIGLKGITQFELAAFPRFPITFRSEVTNQPAGISARPAPGSPTTSTGAGEVGIRSIVQVGYRVVPPLTLAVRGSFQARTINHSGPGAGASVTYEW